MGQYHGVGESHYRTTTLHNDVLPRLRDNSLRRELDRGLLHGVGRGIELEANDHARGLEEEIPRANSPLFHQFFSFSFSLLFRHLYSCILIYFSTDVYANSSTFFFSSFLILIPTTDESRSRVRIASIFLKYYSLALSIFRIFLLPVGIVYRKNRIFLFQDTNCTFIHRCVRT